ncbi:MAG: hypothetical protein LBF08_05185 [Dysgonamonadaceae bacterium]|jgi:hypothetical protein|nr:hypothetical protein [Dysgonamonadaceae bacterium]
MKTKSNVLFLLCLLLFACENEAPEQQADNLVIQELNGEENPYREIVIGKWKLIQISTVHNSDTQNPEIIDCSSDNIIYDFLKNNQLKVSGYMQDDLADGEHFYQYQQPNVGLLALPGPNLTIGSDNQLFCLALADEDTMTIKGEKITGQVVDETGLIVKQGTVVSWIKTFIKLN